MNTIVLSIVNDFSRTPGPRRALEGKFSGEDFQKLLRTKYLEAKAQGAVLLVDLDGAAGYATSFLEAAFGGLAREYDGADLLKVLRFKSDDEPDLEEEIKGYIKGARL